MKSYAQRMKNAQLATPQQNTVNNAHISNQALLGMLNEPDGDTRFSEALRAKFEQKNTSNADGGKPLPDSLRKKYEEKSGLPMDDVRVYYNSDEPAQFDADAFAYGSKVHIAPGKEGLIDHEMAHVAQQKIGQVAATDSVEGVPINCSEELENDADRFALQRNMRWNCKIRPVIQCGKTLSSTKKHATTPAKKKGPKKTSTTRRPSFRPEVKRTYPSSRAAGTSINHIISYDDIRAITDSIAEMALSNPSNPTIAACLRRLVKAVIPIRNVHKTDDSAARKAMLDDLPRIAQNIHQDHVQHQFVSALNSSLPNLRLGNASINSAIGKQLDPVMGTYSLQQEKNKPPLVKFDNSTLCSTSDEFVRIKSIHKLARLTEHLGTDKFYKPIVVEVNVPGTPPSLSVMSSDYSRDEIPSGSKRIPADVTVVHKKKSKPGAVTSVCSHDF